jgi:hypothetical protein
MAKTSPAATTMTRTLTSCYQEALGPCAFRSDGCKARVRASRLGAGRDRGCTDVQFNRTRALPSSSSFDAHVAHAYSTYSRGPGAACVPT